MVYWPDMKVSNYLSLDTIITIPLRIFALYSGLSEKSAHNFHLQTSNIFIIHHSIFESSSKKYNEGFIYLGEYYKHEEQGECHKIR